MVATGVVSVIAKQLSVGRLLLVLAFVAAGVISSPVSPAAASTGTTGTKTGWGIVRAVLKGAAEVPGRGDSSGFGAFHGLVRTTSERLCYQLTAFRLDGNVIGAHIHRGPEGVPGPVVVALQAPVRGFVLACAQATRSLVEEIFGDPDKFYVNVHTSVFPAGAIRGQLR